MLPDMTQTLPAPPPPFYKLNREYYWDFVTFSVDDQLFRVPKYRLIEESEVFALKHGIQVDSDVEGDRASKDCSHREVIELDVAVGDFENFLKAIYPKKLVGTLDLSKEEWISVLKLSTKWFFNDFRKMAIDKLTALGIDAIERVCLAKQYNVSSWLVSGYEDIVNRPEGITDEEVDKIHWKTAIRLYRIRDQRKTTGPSPTVHPIPSFSIPSPTSWCLKEVEATFSAELSSARETEHNYPTFQERTKSHEAAKETAEREAEARLLRELGEIQAKIGKEKEPLVEPEEKRQKEYKPESPVASPETPLDGPTPVPDGWGGWGFGASLHSQVGEPFSASSPVKPKSDKIRMGRR